MAYKHPVTQTLAVILTPLFASINSCTCRLNLACEQALWGALAAGQEKEWELAATSLKLEYLLRKSWCEMLIGWDDISNDVITLALVFQCLCTFALVFVHCRKSDSSVDRKPQGNWRWKYLNSRDIVARSTSFSCPAARAPWKAYLQAKLNPVKLSPSPTIMIGLI